VAEGETVVIRYTFAGTHLGALRGIAATGQPVAVAGMVLLRFTEGKVVEQRGMWDSLSLMQQLGVVAVGESAKDEAVRRRQAPARVGRCQRHRAVRHNRGPRGPYCLARALRRALPAVGT
jgi:hypothetical protein